MLTGGGWQQGAEEIGSGIFELWVQGPAWSHQLWGRGARECWVDSGGCVLSIRQVVQTKANHSLPIQSPPPPSIHLSNWEVMKSSSFPCCDSKSHLSRHIQRDPYSNLTHQHDNKGFVALTACWQNFFFNVLLPNTESLILNHVVLVAVSLGWWNQIQKHLLTRLYETVVVLNNSSISSQQEIRKAKCLKTRRMQLNLVPSLPNLHTGLQTFPDSFSYSIFLVNQYGAISLLFVGVLYHSNTWQ